MTGTDRSEAGARPHPTAGCGQAEARGGVSFVDGSEARPEGHAGPRLLIDVGGRWIAPGETQSSPPMVTRRTDGADHRQETPREP